MDDEQLVDLTSILFAKIIEHQPHNDQRDRFVRGKELLLSTGISIPSSMTNFQIPMDWPRKAVEVFADRLRPRGYSMREKSTLLDDLDWALAESDADLIEPQAIRAAVQYGCGFVFTEPDQSMASGVRVTAASPFDGTAVIDQRTRQVRLALARVDATTVDLFLPWEIVRLSMAAGGRWKIIDKRLTGTERVLCAPYVHQSTLDRPLGVSRISPTVMAATFAATRTLLRQEVSAEFYSAPRSLLLGADKSVFEEASAWSAVLGAVWGLPDVTIDDDQDMPDNLRRAQLQQIPQMSMQPFSDQYRLQASVVSGATSIPLHYLGVVQDSNPTSAQALEAVENDLIRASIGQQPSLNIGRRALALNILAARGVDLSLPELRYLKPRWEDPRSISLSERSQYVALQVQAGNFQPGTEATLRQLPLDPEDAAAIVQDNRRAAGMGAIDRLLAGQASVDGEVPQEAPAEDAPAEASGGG